jgi:AcrR family transcriptional regulator
MTTARSYHSPLRDAQAAQTRDALLAAARVYLETHEIETLSLRRLAELTGVSAPTAYAHFADIDELVAGFFQWLKPRLGLDDPPKDLDGLVQLPRRLFPRYEAHGALLRNLMNRPAWDRQRDADRGRRHAPWIALVGRALPHLDVDQRRRGALALATWWGPTQWRWLRDTASFEAGEAADVAVWSISGFIQALRQNPSGLATAPETRDIR